MKLETAKFLCNLTENMGNQECDLREDYSGRGMMGQTTAGIVVDSVPTLLSDVLNYFKENISESIGEGGLYAGLSLDDLDFPDFRVDNMGTSTILY